MSPRISFLAVATAALLIAGCGGGGGGGSTASTTTAATPTPTALSKSEYLKQADAICAEVNAAVGSVASSSGVASTGKVSQVSQVADIYTGMFNSLKGLGAPEGGGNSKFIAAAEALSKVEGEAKLAEERGEIGRAHV
jgi:hypothetical protein